MFCTIYQSEGKWHINDTWPKAMCGANLQTATPRVIGQGSPRCEPDPPIEEFCPSCWKNHPHFQNKKEDEPVSPKTDNQAINDAIRLFDRYLIHGKIEDLNNSAKEMEKYRASGGTLYRETEGHIKAHLKIGGWKNKK